MERKVYSKEKQIITSTISILLILVLYSWQVYQKYVAGNPELINDFKFWGKSFIIMVPIMIGALILIHIVFAIVHKIITNEDISTVTDEMDRLIDLKALRISHWMHTLGLFLAMGSQALGMQVWVLFVILISSCFIGAIAEGAAKIYFYRRGI